MKWKSSYLPYWLVALLLFLLVSSRSQIRSRLTGCVNHYCPLVFIVFMCKFQGYWVSAACLTFHKTPFFFFLALSLARICFLFLCCHSCICLQLYATSYRLRFGPFESNCIVLIDWNSWPLGLFSVEVFSFLFSATSAIKCVSESSVILNVLYCQTNSFSTVRILKIIWILFQFDWSPCCLRDAIIFVSLFLYNLKFTHSWEAS